MTVKNKWNGQTYEVWESSEKTVKLKKENGEIIEISKSEFNFNYRVEKQEICIKNKGVVYYCLWEGVIP